MSQSDHRYVTAIIAYGVICVNDSEAKLTKGRPYMVTGNAGDHLVQVRDDIGVNQLFHESRFEKGPLCQYCQKPIEFFYGTQINERLAKDLECLNCGHWREIYEAVCKNRRGYYIIEGSAYYDPGDGTTTVGERGFGGARFYIEDFDGNWVTTNNLNHLGVVPPVWEDKILNNAFFTNSRREKKLYGQ